MSGFTQLPPPHHYETVAGTPVVGWWTPDSGSQPVHAVIHLGGQFVVVEAPYRLRQFKAQTSPNSAPDPFVDEYAQGRKPADYDPAVPCDHVNAVSAVDVSRFEDRPGSRFIRQCSRCHWSEEVTVPAPPDPPE